MPLEPRKGLRQFGGEWSDVKLQALGAYLGAYTTALKNQPFSVEYIDAFAGAGRRVNAEVAAGSEGDEESNDEESSYRHGSPMIALAANPRFDIFHFIEKDPASLESLKGQIQEAGDSGRGIRYYPGDANVELKKLCEGNWSTRRAVAFLDPFAMHLSWATVERLGKTRAIDMWLLFPAMAVNRMLPRNGKVPPTWEAKLNDFFGCDEWKDHFYRAEPEDLFGHSSKCKVEGSFENLSAFIKQRLLTAFAGTTDKPLVLRNSANTPIFFLCFACANPSPKAKGLALKIAQYIISKR